MAAKADRVMDLLSDQVGPYTGLREIKACRLLELRPLVIERLAGLKTIRDAGQRIRTHGDFHLGQVLDVEGDFFIIDFEGEPARPLAERRALQSPLRDVAGMLRSLSYAAQSGLRQFLRSRPEMAALALDPWATGWERVMADVFLQGYFGVMGLEPLLPKSLDTRQALLDVFVLDKLVYELGYELGNRPDWVEIPLDALIEIVDPGWTPPELGPGDGNGNGLSGAGHA